jgi:16S rRNA (cytosine967-C5)-methyltransferase
VKLAAIQQNLLRHAAALVRIGGSIVFCTCSLQPEEGPERIARALAENVDLTLSAVTPAEVGGQVEWVTGEGYLRTLPCHAPETSAGTAAQERRGVDGFFAARLTRTR